jgi:peptide/nickel transport system substrate-binding protein
MGDPVGAATGQLEVSGTYTLTATPSTKPAHAPRGHRFTAFTEQLLKVLREGVPDGPELLNMMLIYSTLIRAHAAAGLPRPQQRSTNTAINLEIARNPAWAINPAATLASDPASASATEPEPAAATRPRRSGSAYEPGPGSGFDTWLDQKRER